PITTATDPVSVDALPEWQALAAHARAVADTHLRQLFAADAERARRLMYRAGPFLLDLSRQRIDAVTLEKLQALALAADLPAWIASLFAGEHVNDTEKQAALHMALRVPVGGAFPVAGVDLGVAVERERARMAAMVDRLHAGHWRGYSGRAITDIINIGVGGSDLGPAM